LPHAKKLVEVAIISRNGSRKHASVPFVGNIMEFDIPGHKFTLNDLASCVREASKDLVIDDIDKAYDFAKKANSVLYLADNAGEIVFDTLLVEQLKNMGLKVIYVVKGAPVINDATLDDVEISNMDKLADEILTTGTDAVGLQKKEVSAEFLKVYEAAELVFAKGMGYAEPSPNTSSQSLICFYLEQNVFQLQIISVFQETRTLQADAVKNAAAFHNFDSRIIVSFRGGYANRMDYN